MSRSGVGSFNAIALGKKLAGKKVNVAAGIDGDGEGVRGTASVQDIETMFQLAWLRMTSPRVDTSAYLAFKEQMRAVLANQKNDPESVFGDTVEATMSQHNPRVHLLSPELLDSVDLEARVRHLSRPFCRRERLHLFPRRQFQARFGAAARRAVPRVAAGAQPSRKSEGQRHSSAARASCRKRCRRASSPRRRRR